MQQESVLVNKKPMLNKFQPRPKYKTEPENLWEDIERGLIDALHGRIEKV